MLLPEEAIVAPAMVDPAAGSGEWGLQGGEAGVGVARFQCTSETGASVNVSNTSTTSVVVFKTRPQWGLPNTGRQITSRDDRRPRYPRRGLE